MSLRPPPSELEHNPSEGVIVSASDESGAKTELPANPADPIKVTSPNGDQLGVGVAPDAETGQLSEDGTSVIYTNAYTDTDITAQAGDEGSARIMTVINGPDAPTAFPFPVDGGEETILQVNEGGAVEVSANGTTVASVAPPWAYDANGKEIESWYTVDGNELVLNVDHSETTAYPVVADPAVSAGCGLFTCTIRLDREKTRLARDGSRLAGIASPFCAALTVGAIACGVMVLGATQGLSVAAGRFYEEGDCLGIQIPPVGGVAWPTRVNKGDHNCQ